MCKSTSNRFQKKYAIYKLSVSVASVVIGTIIMCGTGTMACASNISSNDTVAMNQFSHMWEEINKIIDIETANQITKGYITLEENRLDSLLYEKELLDPQKDDDGDRILNGEEVFIYEIEGRKYIGYHSHPKLKDTDGDGISDQEDDTPLEWTISTRDMVLFMELGYRDDDYIRRVLDEAQSLTELYENRQEYALMHKELAPFWSVKETYHESNGFDAILFETKSKYPYMADGTVQVLSIQGTKGVADVDDDLAIFVGAHPQQATTVTNLMRRYQEEGTVTNLYVTGHSLGGYLAQRALIEANNNGYTWMKKAYTFNAPKITGNLFNLWLNELAKKGDELTREGKAEHYIVNNDLAIGAVGTFANAINVGTSANGHGSRTYFEGFLNGKEGFSVGDRQAIDGTGYQDPRLSELNYDKVFDLSKGINPVDPVDPVDSVDSVNPVDSVDPVNPVDSVDPVDPVDSVDPIKKEADVKEPSLKDTNPVVTTVDAPFIDEAIIGKVDVLEGCKATVTEKPGENIKGEGTATVDVEYADGSKDTITVPTKIVNLVEQPQPDIENQSTVKLEELKNSLEILKEEIANKPDISDKTTESFVKYQLKLVNAMNVKEQADALLKDKHAKKADVDFMTSLVKEITSKLVKAKEELDVLSTKKADKEGLKESIVALEQALNREVDTTSKPEDSVAQYEYLKENATPEEIFVQAWNLDMTRAMLEAVDLMLVDKKKELAKPINKVPVADLANLTLEEKIEVVNNVLEANPGLLQHAEIKVADNGDVAATYKDNSVSMLPGIDVVVLKSALNETSGTTNSTSINNTSSNVQKTFPQTGEENSTQGILYGLLVSMLGLLGFVIKRNKKKSVRD